MDFIKSAFNVFLNAVKGQYFDFKGRTNVADFWKFVLVAFVINIVLGIIDGIIGMRLLSGLFGLAILCPMLGIGVRRLHDMGKSGWFQLINLIPLVGTIPADLLVVPALAGRSQQMGQRRGLSGRRSECKVRLERKADFFVASFVTLSHEYGPAHLY